MREVLRAFPGPLLVGGLTGALNLAEQHLLRLHGAPSALAALGTALSILAGYRYAPFA